MILYHGTDESSACDIRKNGIDLKKSQEYLDFGRGFYMTRSISLAEKRARYRAYRKNSVPAVVKFNVSDNAFKEARLLEFAEPNISWAQFILNNRCGCEYMNAVNKGVNNLNAAYDVVVGPTADGNIKKIVDEHRRRNTPASKDDVKALTETRYANQYSVHTEAGIMLVGKGEYVPVRR